MKRVNKSDIAVINEALNTLSCSKLMLDEGTYSEQRAWAEKGYNAMLTLKEYGIMNGAGSEQFWTSTKNMYVNF
jgi:hypothetical protein